MADTSVRQPIIRGIQSVGSVRILYRYNGNGGKMVLPTGLIRVNDENGASVLEVIETKNGVEVSGFRLDGEFLRANPQIASSIVIPILGGGGVALTNNNRTGVLNLNCTKVSTPAVTADENGAMYASGAIGPTDVVSGSSVVGSTEGNGVYDMVFLAQVQQSQLGGDSAGATIDIAFNFCDMTTTIEFQGCTIAGVDPIALTGNDAAGYNVSINYLNWVVTYNNSASKVADNGTAISD